MDTSWIECKKIVAMLDLESKFLEHIFGVFDPPTFGATFDSTFDHLRSHKPSIAQANLISFYWRRFLSAVETKKKSNILSCRREFTERVLPSTASSTLSGRLADSL